MKKTAVLLFLILTAVSSHALQEGGAYHGSNFIKMKPGARANAIGLAYFGFSDDASTLFWNPAGLITLGNNYFQVNAAYPEYNTYEGSFGLIFSNGNYGFGFGGALSQYPGVEKYDVAGNRQGDVSNLQGFGIAGLSFFLTDFSTMGFSLKGGYRSIEGETVYVLAGDMGLMLQFLYFQFVLGVENMGYTRDNLNDSYQFVNPDFSFGISYTKTNNNQEDVFGVSLAVSRGIDLPQDETRLGIGTFIRIWNETTDIAGFVDRGKREVNAFFINLGIENYHGISFSGGFSLHFFGIETNYALIFPSKSRRDFSHYVSMDISF
jgi:hypothetical protein